MGYFIIVGLFIGIHLFLLANLQFTVWPEMVIYPWLASNGFTHYVDLIHPYFPGLIWLLQLNGSIAVEPLNLRIVTWGVILLNDVLIVAIVRRFWGVRAALLALGWYVVWQPYFDGNGLWFDLALVPFLLGSLSFFLAWKRLNHRRDLVLASVLLGAAILVKQSAGVFAVFFLGYIFFHHRRSFLLATLPLAVIGGGLLLFWLEQGIVRDAMYWAVWFPLVEERRMVGFALYPSARELLRAAIPLLPILGVFAVQRHRILLLSLFVVSLLFVFPRWDFLHLQPAVALSAVIIGVTWAGSHWQRKLLLGIGLTLPLLLMRYAVLWRMEDRFLNAETIQVAHQLKEEVGGGSVFVFSGDQLLYPLMEQLPPKPWADWFPWYYEVRGGSAGDRLLQNLQENPPMYVLSDFPTSERIEYRYRPEKIKTFIDQHYDFLREIDGNRLTSTK